MEVKEIMEALTSAEDFLPKKEEGSTQLKQYLSDLPGSIPAKAVMEGKAYSEERERVRHLRMAGRTCDDIAMELEMPEVLVQKYCLELGLPTEGSCRLVELSKDEESWYRDKMQSVPLARLCPQCGQEVHQSRHGSRKIYCSDQCRYRWRDTHRKQNAKGRTAVCENCGQTFTAYGEYSRKQRFCCRECYFEFRNRKAVQGMKKNNVNEAGEKRLPVIGVFPITNTAGICVHEIDYVDDRVLASVNGKDPKWYLMKEDAIEENGELEPGFLFGFFFVPFSEVLKV